ncbi:MAG: glycosyltransferase [Actinobacteria bacterium]|nr:glycosyltransferase [Actinomycetota bacterium]
METLIARSTFQNFDVVVVFDADTPTAAREAIIAAGHGRITPAEYDAEFNFADKVNRGVLASTGEYVLLLNDDTEIITPDALDTLVGLLEDPGVAMAGPLLLYEDGKIQSAGHVLNPIPYDLYRHRSPDHVGAQNLLRVQREVSGVIAACALIRRSVFDLAAVALAAEQVGGAQKVLEMAVEYAKVRVQFGRPIGSFQAIKHKCADMLLEVESAKSAAYYGMWCASEMNAELASTASLAKAYCSEAYFHAAAENIQIHGGIGFTWEHPAHLYFKRAKSSELLFGDPTYHRELLAQRIGI